MSPRRARLIEKNDLSPDITDCRFQVRSGHIEGAEPGAYLMSGSRPIWCGNIYCGARIVKDGGSTLRVVVMRILTGTLQEQLVQTDKPKRVRSLTPEAMARMERELARLQEQITSIQDSYGPDHLQLTVAKGYVAKLLGSARVVRYLMQHRPEFLSEFQAIAAHHPPVVDQRNFVRQREERRYPRHLALALQKEFTRHGLLLGDRES